MYLKVPLQRNFQQLTNWRKGSSSNTNQPSIVFSSKQSSSVPQTTIETRVPFLWNANLFDSSDPLRLSHNSRQVREFSKNMNARILLDVFEKRRFLSFFSDLCFLRFFDISQRQTVPIDFTVKVHDSLNNRLLIDRLPHAKSLIFRLKNSTRNRFDRSSSLDFESLTFSTFLNKLYCFYDRTVSTSERNSFVSQRKSKTDRISLFSNETRKNEMLLSQQSLFDFYFFEVNTKFYKTRLHSNSQRSFLRFKNRFSMARVFPYFFIEKFVFVFLVFVIKEMLRQNFLPKKERSLSIKEFGSFNVLNTQDSACFSFFKSQFRGFCLKSFNNFCCSVRTHSSSYPFIDAKVSTFFSLSAYVKYEHRHLMRSFVKKLRNPIGRFSSRVAPFLFVDSTFSIGRFFKPLNQKQLNVNHLNGQSYSCFFTENFLTFELKTFLNVQYLNRNPTFGVPMIVENSRSFFSNSYQTTFDEIRISNLCFSHAFFILISILKIVHTLQTFLFFKPVRFLKSKQAPFVWARAKGGPPQDFSASESVLSKLNFEYVSFEKHVFLFKGCVLRNRLLFLKIFRIETLFFGFFDRFWAAANSSKSLDLWRHQNSMGLKQKLESIENVFDRSFSSFVETSVSTEISSDFVYEPFELRNNRPSFVQSSRLYLQKKHLLSLERNRQLSPSFFQANSTIYLQELKRIFKTCSSQKQELLLKKLNRTLAQWIYINQNDLTREDCAYLDTKTRSLSWRWCCRRHNNKSKQWIQYKYYRKFQKQRWVFGTIQALDEELRRDNLKPRQKRAVFRARRRTRLFYLPSHTQFLGLFERPGLFYLRIK